jgi:hypothetical protein
MRRDETSRSRLCTFAYDPTLQVELAAVGSFDPGFFFSEAESAMFSTFIVHDYVDIFRNSLLVAQRCVKVNLKRSASSLIVSEYAPFV